MRNKIVYNFFPNASVFYSITILLVSLKLAHVIAWPWYLVLIPAWGPLALIFGFLILLALVAGLIVIAAHFSRR